MSRLEIFGVCAGIRPTIEGSILYLVGRRDTFGDFIIAFSAAQLIPPALYSDRISFDIDQLPNHHVAGSQHSLPQWVLGPH
jgi:hypothetical protein